MDYIADWLYKLGTGLLTAIVCSAIYFEMVEKLLMNLSKLKMKNMLFYQRLMIKF